MKGFSTPDEVTRQLLRGETLAWWDAPRQGFVLAARDGLLIPFSLLWCGFAIFWEASVVRSGAPTPFALFGVPFVLVGLFFVFGRFLLDRWLRRRTVYALTDRRILIVRSGSRASLKALPLDRLPEATLTELPGGRGTIRFGQPAALFRGAGAANMGGWVASLDPTPQFLDIADARRVFAAIQERTVQERASRPRMA